MDKQIEVLDKAGLSQDETWQPRIQAVNGFTCEICCDDTPGMQTFAMKCGHRFCVDCYRQYLTQKIKDEGEAARIKCPGHDCNRIVDSKSLDVLVAPDLKDRYLHVQTLICSSPAYHSLADIVNSSPAHMSMTRTISNGVLPPTVSTL